MEVYRHSRSACWAYVSHTSLNLFHETPPTDTALYMNQSTIYSCTCVNMYKHIFMETVLVLPNNRGISDSSYWLFNDIKNPFPNITLSFIYSSILARTKDLGTFPNLTTLSWSINYIPWGIIFNNLRDAGGRSFLSLTMQVLSCDSDPLSPHRAPTPI